jgi:hypothetical protein
MAIRQGMQVSEGAWSLPVCHLACSKVGKIGEIGVGEMSRMSENSSGVAAKDQRLEDGDKVRREDCV